MEIFRLEHKNMKIGPFNYRLYDDEFRETMKSKGIFDSIMEMPTPRDDGMGEDFRDYFKFGFKNMPCLNKWFRKHLWFFKQFNFVIRCYEITNQDARIGCEQVAYNARRAQLKWEREITE